MMSSLGLEGSCIALTHKRAVLRGRFTINLVACKKPHAYEHLLEETLTNMPLITYMEGILKFSGHHSSVWFDVLKHDQASEDLVTRGLAQCHIHGSNLFASSMKYA
jgi:hypothetical protein